MLILIYLSSNEDSFSLAKSLFMRSPECRKEKLLTKNDEESSLVAYMSEISNLELLEALQIIVNLFSDLVGED